MADWTSIKKYWNGIPFSFPFLKVIFLCLLHVFPVAYAQHALIFNVSGFVIEGDNPLSDAAAHTVIDKYIGQQSGLDGLNAAREELEQKLGAEGYPFYRVVLPAQELFDGEVRFRIVRFTLGQILVEGNEFFSADNIRRSMPYLIAGESPNTQQISRSLAIANQNPAKALSLSFKASEAPEQIDAVLKVTEQNPQLFYTQLNNTGSESGSRSRLTLGYQHNALWDRDHTVSFSYTTSPEDTAAIQQWGVNYQLPLYRHGATLSVLYSDSKVDSGTVADEFQVSGKGTVLGLNYRRPLTRDGNYTHALTAGLSIKNFNNDVSFGGVPIGTDITSQPLTVGYQGGIQQVDSQWSFGVDAALNIPGGSNNSDADYAAVSGGSAGWNAIHYNLGYIRRLGADAILNLRLSGQFSSDLLIPGEQFGIGGAASVRGYEERSVSGDQGYAAGIEYWFSLFSVEGLRFLAFYDLGSVELNEPQSGQQASQSISGVGMGLRYSWKQKLSLNLDIAQARQATDQTAEGDSRLHLSMMYRF